MKQKEEKMDLVLQELPDWIKDTPQNRKYFNEVIDYLKRNDEVVGDVDGFYYWFPKGQGGWDSNSLKIIAHYLDKLNAPLEKNIEEYFEKERIQESD